MAFFIPFTCVTLCQFYSITSPVLFTKNNKLWNERKEDFLYTWLLQRITLYQGRKKIAFLDTIAFLATRIYKQSILTKWWNNNIFVQILNSYLKYPDRLCVFLVVRCNIIRASWETKKERLNYRKKYIEEFVWGTSPF